MTLRASAATFSPAINAAERSAVSAFWAESEWTVQQNPPPALIALVSSKASPRHLTWLKRRA